MDEPKKKRPGRPKKYKWDLVQKFYDEGNSTRDCIKFFGMAKRSLEKAVHRGDLKTRPQKTPIEFFLVGEIKTARHHLKKRILEENLLDHSCQFCGIITWREKELGLHLDHKDGDRTNNRIENLRFLCPNCHSQTPTFAGRNRRKYV